MDIGKLYDENIAQTYDHDERGLLSGGREVAFRQIENHVGTGKVRDVLDLAVGTGESLIAIKKLFPETVLHGIDLSEEMLRIARTKLDFHAIHDDVVNTAKHFGPGSADLILMHFLTTFIDGNDIVSRTAKMLRPGGYYSIVSSTFEAFPRTYALARMVLPDDFIRSRNPAPENAETIVSFCTHAGLEVVAVERFTKTVSFANFEEFYDFGMHSGFFTHVLSHLDEGQIAGLSRMEGIFPFDDRYSASVVIARRP